MLPESYAVEHLTRVKVIYEEDHAKGAPRGLYPASLGPQISQGGLPMDPTLRFHC